MDGTGSSDCLVPQCYHTSRRRSWPCRWTGGGLVPGSRSRPGERPGRLAWGISMHYLDANATRPLRPAAFDAIAAAFSVTGNPSSVHQAGRTARRIVEDAREVIAIRFGTRPQDLVFTSGGTEADAMAIHAMTAGRRLIISAIELDAVRAAAGNPAVLPVGADGVADIDALEALLQDGVPSLVCL